MLLSTIIISGLYAGIPTMQALVDADNARLHHRFPSALSVQMQQKDAASPSDGSSDPKGFAPFPRHAQFETGDTWIAAGRRYRLYGLQACLRGTKITVTRNIKRDCGEMNVMMTQSMIQDTNPVCATIKDIDEHNVVVACRTTNGQRSYDLATYLIAQGWGFAATNEVGGLIVPGYRIAEESARSARAGLWAYPDLPHPVSILTQHMAISQ